MTNDEGRIVSRIGHSSLVVRLRHVGPVAKLGMAPRLHCGNCRFEPDRVHWESAGRLSTATSRSVRKLLVASQANGE